MQRIYDFYFFLLLLFLSFDSHILPQRDAGNFDVGETSAKKISISFPCIRSSFKQGEETSQAFPFNSLV